mgnify:CR=1
YTANKPKLKQKFRNELISKRGFTQESLQLAEARGKLVVDKPNLFWYDTTQYHNDDINIQKYYEYKEILCRMHSQNSKKERT